MKPLTTLELIESVNEAIKQHEAEIHKLTAIRVQLKDYLRLKHGVTSKKIEEIAEFERKKQARKDRFK